MKYFFYLIVLCLFISCSMQYPRGTDEIEYSFKAAKRYTSLNEALKHPEKVIFLDISLWRSINAEQEIDRLNDNISKFTNLKKLAITGNRDHRSHVPENIFILSSLEFLSLTSIDLSHNNLSALKNLEKLKYLGLPLDSLSDIPEVVFTLKSLQALDFTANIISNIPNEISALSDLRTIDLSNNLFNTIPSGLKNCYKLEHLDFNNEEGGQRYCVSLRSMGIGVNLIKTFPDLREFVSLKGLYVGSATDFENVRLLQEKYPYLKFW